jgi:uncharacterized damage-inducible protein DinB
MISADNQLIASQVKYWREQIKPTLDKALECSPEDKFNWAPAANMITLGNIFLHISECSAWWYDEVMKKHKAKELTPSPDSPVPPIEQIRFHLNVHWERLERFYAEKPEILKKTFKVAGHDQARLYDGYWIFTHLLEHDIHHRSQINQYLRILGIIPPTI